MTQRCCFNAAVRARADGHLRPIGFLVPHLRATDHPRRVDEGVDRGPGTLPGPLQSATPIALPEELELRFVDGPVDELQGEEPAGACAGFVGLPDVDVLPARGVVAQAG